MAADLELGLIWDPDQQNFEVSLRLVAPGVDQMAPPLRSAVKIDVDELAGLTHDESAYGARLSEMLFAEPKVEEFRRKALSLARENEVHLRLHIHGPAEYHGLRWELLRAPGEDGLPLATAGNVWFSRFLSSLDWTPIRVRTRPERRALVVIGAPSDAEEFGLAAVDVRAETERARAALQGYQVDVLGGGGSASLVRMFEQFEKHEYEVLYLVAHGKLIDDEPHLVLEKADGTRARVDGLRLAERIHGLEHPPTLAMLLSCRSADAGTTVPLAGMGPRISAAGIPAVIAMQGDVTMETAGVFASAFFKSFRDRPIVDRAMAKARTAVRERRDWWAPVLFSRLRSGRAYLDEAFTAPPNDIWEDFSALMEAGQVTPVLGPGLTDGILGSRAEIAQRWVNRWQMPIVAHGRGNLAQVAQYLRVLGRAPTTVRTYLRKYLMSDIMERVEVAREGDPFHDLPAEALRGVDPLPALMEVGKRRWAANENDPYRIAAALPVPVFFTTGWTDLLQAAMRARGKTPRTLVFPWYPRAGWKDVEGADVFDWEPPTEDSPWIMQLFGRLDQPDSLVLTEDDYFTWLGRWIENRPVLSEHLSEFSSALIENSLLFVGYQLRDWDFQVVFRGIQSFGGADLLLQRQHIGVQLMPEVDVIEPEAARRYLKSYLKNSNVEIFWNDAESFLAELREQTGVTP
ncbi:CHAT domain-containing protein [Lentzea sp. E54]|uniref:CHAT domain-containing protein n=1 Tax=Lentzea xerophila TaxID=3435883 RepID=UPI003DA59F4A